ncbi:hypothetical protein [Clostridium sp. BJN0013]|uniref:hypothetical protein n=1 Tax=Clostridium sp. BJN0013 TaxID=3236840 RepID=UPI0034C5C91D
MKNLYFLPYWYIQNRENKKNKNLKFFILIILIFTIILFNIYSINKDKLSSIENKLKDYASMQKSQYSRDNTIKSFMDFYDYIHKERNFKSINIENRNIEIDIVGKEQECFSLIKDIENSSKFMVKNFNFLGNEKEENEIWKINLLLK